MASIRKVKNKWEARVRVKGHATYCKSFKQKSDALAWSKSVEVGLETGITPLTRVNKTLSFKDAVEKYLQQTSRTAIRRSATARCNCAGAMYAAAPDAV